MIRKHFKLRRCALGITLGFLLVGPLSAQFLDPFNGSSIALDQKAMNGWAFYTGDGTVAMDFRQGDGCASIFVDATRDRRNVWWALIRRRVSADLDMGLLSGLSHEIRVETRVRVSHAPRRINLHLNTQRTTDYHTHLMEYDIADTSSWHTLSMTTRDFDARPGDMVYAQLALMDWGLDKYQVDIDYFKVDMIDARTAGQDAGNPVPYHPPIADAETFAHHLAVGQDATIDMQYPDMNFNSWCTKDRNAEIPLLSAAESQIVILRWDLKTFSGKRAVGSGLLEITTHSVQRSSAGLKDFGMVRVVEILGGRADWDETDVTFNALCGGDSVNNVLNPQMIIDADPMDRRNGVNWFTVPNPVLQRLIDGRTLGLAIRPLGAVQASFYAREYMHGKLGAKLHLNAK
jgi:hypothetical protein